MAAKDKKAGAAAAKTAADEIDGLAAAVARANLGAAVLADAAAWIAAAGARSVAQLEQDDIDGAPFSHGRRRGLRMRRAGPGWFVCLLALSGEVRCGAELVASLALPKIPARDLKRALEDAGHVRRRPPETTGLAAVLNAHRTHSRQYPRAWQVRHA